MVKEINELFDSGMAGDAGRDGGGLWMMAGMLQGGIQGSVVVVNVLYSLFATPPWPIRNGTC